MKPYALASVRARQYYLPSRRGGSPQTEKSVGAFVRPSHFVLSPTIYVRLSEANASLNLACQPSVTSCGDAGSEDKTNSGEEVSTERSERVS
jgi:hypothetical protein